MEGIERIAIVVRDPDYTYEGLRSTLGLLVDNLWGAVFVIDTEVELPPGKTDDDFEGYLDMAEDLEGGIFTNVQANVDKWGFFEYADMDSIIEKLRTYQIIVPF